jgi:hypothetical protein
VNPTTTDEMTGRRLSRRQMLKGAGALSAIGMVAALLPTTAQAGKGGKTGYQFLDLSDGTGGLSGKTIFMNGVGKVGSGVTGGGDYVIFDATTGSALDFGTWRAKKLISFANVGTAVAGFLGATLTMDVVLKSANGGKTEATATVNCDDGVVSPDGGDDSGDVVTLVIKNGAFAGTFGPGSSLGPFNVTIFIAASD